MRSIFRMLTKLQFISNTFVHRLGRPLRINPIGPELALLGNIGALGHPATAAFLRDCDANFDRVYWVPGPLEWNTRQARAYSQREELASICSNYKRVMPMLQTKLVRPNGTHILGTTLWSGQPATPECPHSPDFFLEDMRWLDTALMLAPEAIILTHHTPLRYLNQLQPKIKWWLYGEAISEADQQPASTGKFRSNPLSLAEFPDENAGHTNQ